MIKLKKDHIEDVNLPRIRTLDKLVSGMKNSIWGELGVQLEALGQTSIQSNNQSTDLSSVIKVMKSEKSLTEKREQNISEIDWSKLDEQINLSESITKTGFQTDLRPTPPIFAKFI